MSRDWARARSMMRRLTSVMWAVTPWSPGTLAPSKWTPIGTTAAADSPGTVERRVDVDAAHVLLWFTRLGNDDACTSSNPYRGQIAEVAYAG